MTIRSVAPPPRPHTRELRALELIQARGHEIVRTAPFTYNVPSCSGEDFYVVRYEKRRANARITAAAASPANTSWPLA